MDEKELDVYSYENRAKIYEEARKSLLELKPFEINGKSCDSLIDVMREDVNYLCSLLEDVKEVMTEDENGKLRRELKVSDTPLNNQLSKIINLISQRIESAKKLNVELRAQVEQQLDMNKVLKKALNNSLDNQVNEDSSANEELLKNSEEVFTLFTNLLNDYVENDTIAITIVEYRNRWINEYGDYYKKHKQ